MMSYFIAIGVVLRVLLPAWLMDRLFGDPVSLPHPVIWFGKMIAFGEKRHLAEPFDFYHFIVYLFKCYFIGVQPVF